jgi:hypothetical protein
MVVGSWQLVVGGLKSINQLQTTNNNLPFRAGDPPVQSDVLRLAGKEMAYGV